MAQLYHAVSDESFSTILTNDELKELEKLINLKIRKQKLLYRGSSDGFTAKKFHEKCDGKANTLTLVKSKNGENGLSDSREYVFGGFTTQSWDADLLKKDENAFIFSLKNVLNRPEKMMIKESSNYAIMCSPGCGPIFDNAFSIKFSSNNYAGLLRHSFLSNSPKSPRFLAGSNKFDVQEMEVFQIIYLS